MSGVYIGVDGKARKVKGGYIGIDGVARKIKKGYIGVDGVAQLCWTAVEFDPVFANNTWEEIALACQLNAVPDSWAVGDQKTMKIDVTDYTIDIIGKNHDDYADGSGKAPLTFQLHDCYNTTYRMDERTGAVNWIDGEMRLTTLVAIKAKMPTEVQNLIKGVTKFSYGTRESTDELFLLSEVEVFGNATNSFFGEGEQYAFYADGGTRIKKFNGVAESWWLRSVYKSNSANYVQVNSGGSSGYISARSNRGVSFAFCF